MDDSEADNNQSQMSCMWEKWRAGNILYSK